MAQHAPPSLVIVGYTNIDENITPSFHDTVIGGGGYFAALGARLITSKVGLVTKVGVDFDTTFLESLFPADGVIKDFLHSTSRSIQKYSDETDLSKRDIQLLPGTSEFLSPEDIPDFWYDSAKLFHISTMPPLQQKKFIASIKLRSPHAQIAMDTDNWLFADNKNIPFILDNMRQVDIVFVNRAEFDVLAAVTTTHPHVIAKADRDGAKVVVFGEIVDLVPTKKVVVRDATGAGDILAGVYLACKVEGSSQTEALRQAVHLATKSVTEVGVSHLFADI